MCGRFACSLSTTALQERLRKEAINPKDCWRDQEFYSPSYNVSPRRWIPVVRCSQDGYILQTMKWGFISRRAKEKPEHQPINARDDTLLTQRSMFDSAKDDGRCIVVAEGFYEWKNVNGKKKIPYFTKRKDGKLMLFAGLCDTSNIDKSEKPITTCTIITTDASEVFSSIHDRMPVILDNDDLDQLKTWLDPSPWSSKQEALLKPFAGALTIYQVTDAVGSIKNNSPDFVVPVDELKGSITSFFQKTKKPQGKADAEKPKKTESKASTTGKREHEEDNEDPRKKKKDIQSFFNKA